MSDNVVTVDFTPRQRCIMCDGRKSYGMVGPGGSVTVDPCDCCHGTGTQPEPEPQIYQIHQPIQFRMPGETEVYWFDGTYLEYCTQSQMHLVSDTQNRGYYVNDVRLPQQESDNA